MHVIVCIPDMIKHVISPHDHDHDLSNIYLYSSPSTSILRTHKVRNQLPVGLIAQLVEHCSN